MKSPRQVGTTVSVAGELVFPPSLATFVLSHLRGDSTPSSGRDPLDELTPREREVLGLMAEGRSNQAVSERLHVSAKTVGGYVSSIFAKLQVADRAQAIVRAREAGLGGSEK